LFRYGFCYFIFMAETDDIGILKALVHSLLAEVERLKARVYELEAQNAELSARLAQTSANSHKPPSSDGYKKKPHVKPALPKEPGKKPGGQAGHSGQTLEMVGQPDLIHCHEATHCGRCGLTLAGEGLLVARRQVFDLPKPRLWVEEHQLIARRCRCGCVQTGQFPAHVTAPVQYGPRIQAQSLLLNVDYRIPLAKVSRLWGDLTGYSYNPATLATAQAVAYERLAPIEQQIKEQLIQAPVCHFDETGIRLGGKLHWLHVACTPQYTHLFVHPKRGQDALCCEQSVFEDCRNWIVHDCWASYFTAGKGRHSLCGAHLLRELQALVDQGRQWASALHAYLLKAYQATRCGPIVPKDQPQWLDEYERLCQRADQEETPALVFFKADGSTGRAKRSKGRNLLQRLIRHQQAVLAFAFEPGVPFTNNQAERDLRPAKVKQKVSNCFRTLAGGTYYARIAGFISTMRKNGLNVIDQLTNVLCDRCTWAT
jgi:transposase